MIAGHRSLLVIARIAQQFRNAHGRFGTAGFVCRFHVLTCEHYTAGTGLGAGVVSVRRVDPGVSVKVIVHKAGKKATMVLIIPS